MRKILASLFTVALLTFGGSAQADDHKVTICHVAGRADDPANLVEITLARNAVFKDQGGHFFEDGTPQAGHEQDIVGPCPTPTTTTEVPSSSSTTTSSVVIETTTTLPGTTSTTTEALGSTTTTPTSIAPTTSVESGTSTGSTTTSIVAVDLPPTPARNQDLPETGSGTWTMAIIATMMVALGTAFRRVRPNLMR